MSASEGWTEIKFKNGVLPVWKSDIWKMTEKSKVMKWLIFGHEDMQRDENWHFFEKVESFMH